MKTAVVFGGAGFIGSHVADKLTGNGYKTVVFDLMRSPWLSPHQNMIVGDILDSDAVANAVIGADVVYNFAALADLNLAKSHPKKTIRINIEGNLNVLDACVKHSVSRFIFASTVYVHSRQGSFYRCSKQAAEAYTEEYNRRYGLPYTILRFGSLYGPRADESNGMRRIVEEALANGTLTYRGNREATREYIHVEDASLASVALLRPEFQNQCIVLTGQESIKVFDLLKMLGEILGLGDECIKFIDECYDGHYVRTPYSFQERSGKKYIPTAHVDLGQGLLNLIEELSTSKFNQNRNF